MVNVPQLEGHFIRLEPLSIAHIDGLAAASSGDRDHFRWSQVPRGPGEVARYIETALKLRDQGSAAPFVTVRKDDGAVIGSTRFFDLERWPWPATHERSRHAEADVGEIGFTWLHSAAIRTGANSEAKLLMLTHAFEVWNMLRICLHTDERNARSRAAIVRIGGRFEGILRSHRMAVDIRPRDSARYSILASEWPTVKKRLVKRIYER